MRQHIENLIGFQIENGIISPRDYNYVRNQLYSLLNLTISEVIYTPEKINYPSDALNPILDELEKENILDGTIIQRDLFDSKLMNVFAGLPSTVEYKFNALKKESTIPATNWLFNYAKNLNYIRYDRILKNKYFEVNTDSGNLQITINLSKPEKDPKSIALALSQKSSHYPKCALCIENEGYSGDMQKDSRNQHRLISLELNNEPWFFQYSPYIYYNEHAIVLSGSHRPMKIGEHTFNNLLSLTDKFDGYFFGSNADLPIVGGSILTHDHYQGGRHHFPIEFAEVSKTFTTSKLSIESLKWPLTTLRLKSKDKEHLIGKATQVLDIWKNYSNPNISIHAFTDVTPHNTITPIARKENDLYVLDLILRNNRTDDNYPLGIFHPHADKWHIKKENIGLIEAAGMAILPARLVNEIEEIKSHILSNSPITSSIEKHLDWIKSLKENYTFTSNNIDSIIENEIGLIFEKVLIDCGVFKLEDIDLFNQFIEEEIYEKISK